MMEFKYPRITDWANFECDDKGNVFINGSLKKDYKEFVASIQSMNNGDDNYSNTEYEAIYSMVAKNCNLYQTHKIWLYKDRYIVKTTDEFKRLRYNDMTVEERKKEDISDYRNKLLKEKSSLKEWLAEHDYIATKIITGRATKEDYESDIETMSKYADRINEIDKELSKL